MTTEHPFPPLSETQASMLRDRWQYAVKQNPRMRTLRDRLLADSGTEVVFPVIEEDLEILLLRGRFRSGRGAVSVPGIPGRCHENAANLVLSDPENLILETGYALSDDGLWRQHSWVVTRDKSAVIETTERRYRYFGAPLPTRAAQEMIF